MLLEPDFGKLEKTEKLFNKPGFQFKESTQAYACHIHKIGVLYADQIRNYLCFSHFIICGVRKGSGRLYLHNVLMRM
jgi:hypothetical protein